MSYLSLLKEAVSNKPNKSEPVIKDTKPRKLDKNLKQDFKRLWQEFEKDNNKHVVKLGKPSGGNSPSRISAAVVGFMRGFFYIHDDTLLGFLILLPPPAKKFETLTIPAFMVDPKYRGKGIGSALMKKAFDVAKEEGYKRLMLDVWESNKNAKNLYIKHGFKRVSNTMIKNV
jgi:ribosomal protein S18 acetylase RimI-like enzyme